MKLTPAQSYWILILMNAIWGGSYALSKWTLQYVPSATLAAIRFVVGGAILWWLVPAHLPPLRRNDWRDLFIVGALGIALAFMVHYAGLAATTATKASIEVALEPLFILCLAVVFLGESFSWRFVLSMLISLFGTVLLVGGGKDWGTLRTELIGGGEFYGDGMMILSVILGAVYTVANKPVSGRVGALKATAVGCLLGGFMLVPLAIRELLVLGLSVQWSWGVVASIAFQALICTALGYYLWNDVLIGLPASVLGMTLNIQPLAGVLVGILWLGESLAWLGWFGAALIILGVAVAPTSADPADKTTAPESEAVEPA